MQSSRGNSRSVRKRLADGTVKTYYYAKERKKKGVQYPTKSVGALLESYERSPEFLSKKPHTRQMYSIYIRYLAAFLNTPVRELSRQNVLGIRDAMAQKKPGAANGFARVVSAVMNWAVDRGWIEANPLARVRSVPGGHLEAWTEGQAERAIKHLPEPLRRVVILGRYTGQRRNDLISMDWSAYDGHAIRVRQGKFKSGGRQVDLRLPVHPDLKAELDAWKQEASSTRILTTTAGLPWKPTTLSHAMARELRRIGMPPRLNVHGLRKLAAASLAEAGCSPHEIAAITGHQTLAMVEFYTKSAEQRTLAESAIRKLQTVARKPTPNRG